MKSDEFQLKSYTWKELAVLYGPDLKPESAGKRLTHWVKINTPLYRELQQNGWQKGKRSLTPLQVETIVNYLGQP